MYSVHKLVNALNIMKPFAGSSLQETLHYLVLTTLVVERIGNSLFHPLGLTAQSFKILYFVVNHKEKLTPSDIQKVLGLSMASISQRLNTLEKRGYVKRLRKSKGAKDGREVHILPTAQGIRIYKEAWKHISRVEDKVIQNISKKESDAFLSALKKHRELLLNIEQELHEQE